MRNFQPIVKAVKESGDYEIFSFVVDGSIKVVIEEMCGYNFRSDDIKEEFIMELEKFKSCLDNAPDDFNDNDRMEAKDFVEKLLKVYFKSGKLM
ncbi:hypothetical protein BEP19_07405 [Ammoniphilus oxalaticus]|uniref:Uncharacterized protein n=1 Tax=Ammoniphilus oxalaticus TaxID=66863 RepID=A0A419SJM9_9BACL|nr:hypothetical protein [Ammoniphilus oxalaticus]RKD24223.1 hypothetical protein BEP19_07405 [Ammoniphilus oxalaticus]